MPATKQISTVSYYVIKEQAYLEQLVHPGADPWRAPNHNQGETMSLVLMDDLGFNNYVSSGWIDVYYGNWRSGIEVVRFSECVDHGYHKGKRIIGHLCLIDAAQIEHNIFHGVCCHRQRHTLLDHVQTMAKAV